MGAFTIEELLRTGLEHGIIDWKIRARKAKSGRIICYIHADGFDSETKDFYVNGNDLEILGKIIPE